MRIEDFPLTEIVRPGSVAELAAVVSQAAAEKRAGYPFAGQTQLELGFVPSRPGVGIDLAGLDQVIDFPARDMTITVQSGISLDRLRELLAAENLRLPVDVPRARQATLGGSLAVNASGPRRYGFGTFRDYVIGMQVLNDEGKLTKSGGRVVKNVAGYDLAKLHIGALGTLGIITEVTLKLKPLPEDQALLSVACQPEHLGRILELLHATRTRPVCLDLLNPAAVRTSLPEHIGLLANAWQVMVGFEDNRVAVAWQVDQLRRELEGTGFEGIVHRGSTAQALWSALVEFQAWPEAHLSFKANLLPSAVAGFCRQASMAGPAWQLQAQAGNGIVHGHLAGDLTIEAASGILHSLREMAVAAHGNLLISRCPAAWKKSLPLWGSPRGDRALMQAVKRNLDPHDLFNPGRFVV